MNKYAKALLSAVAGLLLLSPAIAEEAETRTAQEIVTAEPSLSGRIVQAEVDGMVCDFCAQSLAKVLMKNEAVETVSISLETRFVTITTKEGTEISDEDVAEAVNWAGYDLAGIIRA